MEITDYYAEPVQGSIAYNAGRAAGRIAGRAANSVKVLSQGISPVQAAGAVMLAWGAVAGVFNFRRYKKGRITQREAITATASESVGMGLAAGLGLFADGIVKTYILTTTAPAILPFVAGVAVTTAAKITWNCKTKNNMIWCDATGQHELKSPAEVH